MNLLHVWYFCCMLYVWYGCRYMRDIATVACVILLLLHVGYCCCCMRDIDIVILLLLHAWYCRCCMRDIAAVACVILLLLHAWYCCCCMRDIAIVACVILLLLHAWYYCYCCMRDMVFLGHEWYAAVVYLILFCVGRNSAIAHMRHSVYVQNFCWLVLQIQISIKIYCPMPHSYHILCIFLIYCFITTLVTASISSRS